MFFDRFAGLRASKGRWWMWGVLAMILAASTARAQDETQPPPPPTTGWKPRIVREGTLSLGLQGEYGSLIGNSGFGAEYNHGPAIAVRVRYRFAEDQAVGFSFEGQRFDAKVDSADAFAPKYLNAITTEIEYYNYFQTRSRTPQFLMIGAGLLQTRRHLNDSETDFPGDGGVISLGAGAEYWWKRTLTFELSLRYNGFIHNDNGTTSLTHGVQAGLGFHYYTSP
jgi:opacity protein-like surface antigen